MATNIAPVTRFRSGPVKLGYELLVNTATAGNQFNPRTTALVGGNFLVTWTDDSAGVDGASGDSSGSAVKGQLYAANGRAIGGEFLVNTAVANGQSTGRTTALSTGGFVVTWVDDSRGIGGAGGDTSLLAVKAQIFAADGTRVGGEVLVNTATAGNQGASEVTALSDGRFIMTWLDSSAGVGGNGGDTTGTAVKAQVFSNDGSRVGSEQLVNTATAGDQYGARAVSLAGGGYVVTWLDGSLGVGGAGGDTSGLAIKAQVYARDGSRIGGEVLVNTATANDQRTPVVSALATGGFVVSWEDLSLGVGGAGGDAAVSAVKAQIFASDGSRIGGELLVNTATAGAQFAPRVATLSGGAFVITWNDLSAGVGGAEGDTSSGAIKAQMFAADGSRIGTEFLVNTATRAAQTTPDIVALSNGGFAIVWTDGSAGLGGATGDSLGQSIKAQAYAADGSRIGGELLVNTAVSGNQSAPTLAALAGGGFVVSWNDSSFGIGGTIGDSSLVAVKSQVFTFADGFTAIEQVNVSLKGRLEVSDADAGSGIVTATITVVFGTVTASAGTSGATVTANGTAGVTITGTIAQINDLLGQNPTSTLNYIANLDAPPASTTLTFTVNDGGNSGEGGAKSSTSTQVIAISPVNDAPFGTDSSRTVAEETALTFSAADFGYSDIDGHSFIGVVITSAPVGSLTNAGIPVRSGTFVSIADINAGRLQFTSLQDFTGTTGLTFQVRDSGPTGGGAGSNTDLSPNRITLSIAQVNDAPVAVIAPIVRAIDTFTASTSIAADDTGPEIKTLANGNFVITWQSGFSRSLYPSASDGTEVRAQLFASNGTRIGGEILVNSVTVDDQAEPSITALSNGGFVVAWVDYSQAVRTDTGEVLTTMLKTQVFAADGQRVGGETVIDTDPTKDQGAPQITALSDGGFVATWIEEDPTNAAANPPKVNAQVFAADGSKLGTEILVSGAMTIAENVTVTKLANGGFVLAWTNSAIDPSASGDGSGSSVKAQIFTANGTRVGGEFLVNSATLDFQYDQKVTALANGNFVVTWTDTSEGVGGAPGDTWGSAVKAQVFAIDGTRIGGERLVNTSTNNEQSFQQIAALSNGGFVVTWEDRVSNISALKAQMFDAAGDRVGGELLVSAAYNLSGLMVPQIVALQNGEFAISWEGISNPYYNSMPYAVRTQVFAADGSRLGGELVSTQAAPDRTLSQASPRLTALANGDFALAWSDLNQVGGSNSVVTTIRTQIFTHARALDATATPEISLKGRLAAYDIDSTNQPVTATLSVTEGTLSATAGTITGMPVGVTISGNGTSRLTVTGNNLAALNAFLDTASTSTLRYATAQYAPTTLPTLTFTVTDNGGLSSTTTTTIIVPTSAAPTAVADSATTTEAAVVTVAVAGNDTDADGGPKAVVMINGTAAAVGTAITLASGATATLQSDGTIAYNPNGRFAYLVSAATAAATGATAQATDAFSYALNGGSTATVTVTVTGVDGPGDELRGGAGADIITGTSGDDLINLSQGGSDAASGGAGNDGFYMGAALDPTDRIDGGAGISDQIGLQGDYPTRLILARDTIVNIESLVLLSGSDTRFGASGTAFHSYNIKSDDGTVAAGNTLTVQANTLRAGENLIFDGSAETDGSFLMYGGLGVDVLTGGQGNDGFLFGQDRFGTADRVDGQGGNLDQIGLQGDYSGAKAIIFGANQIVGIESIVLLTAADTRFGAGGTSFSYTLTMNDGNVAAGQVMTIQGNRLSASERLSFDAGAETDGRYVVYGGAGNDVIAGGLGDDVIWGRSGVDRLRGGGGNDVFVYQSASESVWEASDSLLDFSRGDLIDLSRTGLSTFIGSAAFSAAGQVRITTGSSGWVVLGDVDGDGVADLAIDVLIGSDYAWNAADFRLAVPTGPDLTSIIA